MPSPADRPNPGIKLGSPASQVDSLRAELPGKPTQILVSVSNTSVKYNDFPVVGNTQASLHSNRLYKLGQFQIFISIILKIPLRNAVL